MNKLKVRIIKLLDSTSYPEWIECKMTDFYGIEHIFHDKLPIFTDTDIDLNSLPCDGVIRCKIVGKNGNGSIKIDTNIPDDIENSDGQNIFDVSENQIM